MSAITNITDHENRALDRLLEQQKAKPVLAAVVGALSTQVQALENMFQSLLSARAITTATGDQLDGLGALVGEPRNGRTDTEFRIAIRARIAINRSSGTANEILGVLTAATADPAEFTLDFKFVPEYPAGFAVRAIGILSAANAALLAGLAGEAKAAGVRGLLEYVPELESNFFRFDDAAEGFDDADDALGGAEEM